MKKKTEDVDIQQVTESFDMDSALKSLLEETGEDFQATAKTIFENAVNAKVSSEIAELEEKIKQEYEENLKEEIDALAEKVQFFIEELAKEYVLENLDTLEKNYRYELAEAMISDLKAVFEKHSIEIDDSALKEYEELSKENEKILEDTIKLSKGYLDLEEKFNSLIQENSNIKKEKLVETLTENLTIIEKEKFDNLISSMNENKSYDDFEVFAKSIVNVVSNKKQASKQINESLDDDFIDSGKQVSGKMSQYMNHVNKVYGKK